MQSVLAISLQDVAKRYQIFNSPKDRLKQFVFGRWRRYYREFWALRQLSLDIRRGEVIGLVGRNGAGKSTFLQLVCGTLTPSSGQVQVNGRIAALLELGAGFNPDFTGRENVYLNAAILGLSKAEVDARFEQIAAFADIGDFIEQPVKTYSSGMYVRLAFSVAINVDPDILIVDEALSVGDGLFSRKSFDRIMELKEAGKTILFCSHSMYQIEAICNRAIWLERGEAKMIGEPHEVVAAYNDFLNSGHDMPDLVQANDSPLATPPAPSSSTHTLPKITDVVVSVDGISGKQLDAHCGRSDLLVRVRYAAPAHLPTPSLAIALLNRSGMIVASAGSINDGLELTRQPDGSGEVAIEFPALPLLKGEYGVSLYLMCEKAIHVYEHVDRAAVITVSQTGLAQGVVELPHRWHTDSATH